MPFGPQIFHLMKLMFFETFIVAQIYHLTSGLLVTYSTCKVWVVIGSRVNYVGSCTAQVVRVLVNVTEITR